MLALITRASDFYSYEVKEVSTIEDLLNIYSEVIVRKNPYHNNDNNLNEVAFRFKKEDLNKIKEATIEVTIYDDYIE